MAWLHWLHLKIPNTAPTPDNCHKNLCFPLFLFLGTIILLSLGFIITSWESFQLDRATCHTLLSHPLVTLSCHALFLHPVVTPCFHNLPSHSLVAPCCHTLLSHSVVTPCCHTLLSQPFVTPCCHTLLSHPVVTPCFLSLFSHLAVTPRCYTLLSHSLVTPCCHTLLSHYVVTPCCHTLLSHMPIFSLRLSLVLSFWIHCKLLSRVEVHLQFCNCNASMPFYYCKTNFWKDCIVYIYLRALSDYDCDDYYYYHPYLVYRLPIL